MKLLVQSIICRIRAIRTKRTRQHLLRFHFFCNQCLCFSTVFAVLCLPCIELVYFLKILFGLRFLHLIILCLRHIIFERRIWFDELGFSYWKVARSQSKVHHDTALSHGQRIKLCQSFVDEFLFLQLFVRIDIESFDQRDDKFCQLLTQTFYLHNLCQVKLAISKDRIKYLLILLPLLFLIKQGGPLAA